MLQSLYVTSMPVARTCVDPTVVPVKLDLLEMEISVKVRIYRGYYVAARGYEFYLRVLIVSLTRSLRSLVSDTISTRR